MKSPFEVSRSVGSGWVIVDNRYFNLLRMDPDGKLLRGPSRPPTKRDNHPVARFDSEIDAKFALFQSKLNDEL
jgi:hypothetical protein